MSITVVCVKENGKLRVKPAANNGYYDSSKNIQFPKELRREGARYEVSSLEFDDRGFYRAVGDICKVKAGRKPTTKSPKPPKFKMRQPPTALERETKSVFVETPKSGGSMGSMCEALSKQIVSLFPDKGYKHLTKEYLLENINSITVSERKTGRSYYAVRKIVAIFEFPESDGDYTKRMKSFEKELAEYNGWRKQFAPEIAAIEARKKQKKDSIRADKEAKIARKMLQLQQQLGRLNKDTK